MLLLNCIECSQSLFVIVTAVQALGCASGDQRVQARELRNGLENIREGLKQMKGRVSMMTEKLDVPDRAHTPSQPLEPHERTVRTHSINMQHTLWARAHELR